MTAGTGASACSNGAAANWTDAKGTRNYGWASGIAVTG
jgi:hypothetical protein